MPLSVPRGGSPQNCSPCRPSLTQLGDRGSSFTPENVPKQQTHLARRQPQVVRVVGGTPARTKQTSKNVSIADTECYAIRFMAVTTDQKKSSQKGQKCLREGNTHVLTCMQEKRGREKSKFGGRDMQ